jgi:hypothetical protein
MNEALGFPGPTTYDSGTRFFYALWGGVDLGMGQPSHPGWYYQHGGICPVGPFESKEAAIKFWQEVNGAAAVKKAVRAAYLLTPIYRAYGAWVVSYMSGERRYEIFGPWHRMQALRTKEAARMALESFGYDHDEVEGALSHSFITGSAESRVHQFLKMKEFQSGE